MYYIKIYFNIIFLFYINYCIKLIFKILIKLFVNKNKKNARKISKKNICKLLPLFVKYKNKKSIHI